MQIYPVDPAVSQNCHISKFQHGGSRHVQQEGQHPLTLQQANQ